MAYNRTTPWVFVSHSSEDLKQVRVVRNFLRRKARRPCCFTCCR